MFIIFTLALSAVLALMVIGCVGTNSSNMENEMRQRRERTVQARVNQPSGLASVNGPTAQPLESPEAAPFAESTLGRAA